MNNKPKDQLPGLVKFGYEGNQSGPEYEYWREEFCQRVLVADIVPVRAKSIRAKMTAAPLPNLNVTHFEGSAAHFVARGDANGGAFALVMPPRVATRIVIKSRSLDISPGAVGLADAALRGADVTINEDGALRAVFIDRSALLDIFPAVEERLAQPIVPNEGVATLLDRYHEIVIETAHLLDPLAKAAVAQHLLDLTALALGAGGDTSEIAKKRGLAAARLEAIKSDILERIGDASLNLNWLAKRHRASSRYIQMLFEQSGTTFSEFVVEQRLRYAHRLLSNPLYQKRKITDLAHLAGFNDVSYFHRRFRRRFGVTPSDVRNGAT